MNDDEDEVDGRNDGPWHFDFQNSLEKPWPSRTPSGLSDVIEDLFLAAAKSSFQRGLPCCAGDPTRARDVYGATVATWNISKDGWALVLSWRKHKPTENSFTRRTKIQKVGMTG